MSEGGWPAGEGQTELAHFCTFGLAQAEIDGWYADFRARHPGASYEESLKAAFEYVKAHVAPEHYDWLLESYAWHAFRLGWGHLAMLRELRSRELERLRAQGIARVVIAENGCAACERLRGTELSIEQALATMPLPPPDCTCHMKEAGDLGGPGYCEAVYHPALEGRKAPPGCGWPRWGGPHPWTVLGGGAKEAAARGRREDAARIEEGHGVLRDLSWSAGTGHGGDAALGKRICVRLRYRSCDPAGVGLYELIGEGPRGMVCVFRFPLADNERDLDALEDLESGTAVTVEGRISGLSAGRVTLEDPMVIEIG